MTTKEQVAIVIPTHKSEFDSDESISLRHLIHFLGKYDKYFVIPKTLTSQKFEKLGFKVVKFEKEHFVSNAKYCELLNTANFYLPFTNYEYILVYQLDSLVFSDQLIFWCNKGYDFIGAPLFQSLIGYLTCPKNSPITGGNGGFSLRKVKSFINVIKIAESQAKKNSNSFFIRKVRSIQAVLTFKSHQKWLAAPPSNYPFHEDGFWSYEAAKYDPDFKVAPFSEALKFAFERFPRKCFELNNKRLPFGCHAWTKYNRKFWLPYLENS